MEQRYETFTTQIAKINRCIKKIKGKETEEYHLKTPHVSCLYYLYKHGTPLTATELCEVCDEDKGAVSRALDFLEKNGYLTAQSTATKRYNAPLCLTTQGQAMGAQIDARINQVLATASQGLTPAELSTFYKGLLLISNNLQAFCQQYDQ